MAYPFYANCKIFVLLVDRLRIETLESLPLWLQSTYHITKKFSSIIPAEPTTCLSSSTELPKWISQTTNKTNSPKKHSNNNIVNSLNHLSANTSTSQPFKLTSWKKKINWTSCTCTRTWASAFQKKSSPKNNKRGLISVGKLTAVMMGVRLCEWGKNVQITVKLVKHNWVPFWPFFVFYFSLF